MIPLVSRGPSTNRGDRIGLRHQGIAKTAPAKPLGKTIDSLEGSERCVAEAPGQCALNFAGALSKRRINTTYVEPARFDTAQGFWLSVISC
jgi:hypothetical protein